MRHLTFYFFSKQMENNNTKMQSSKKIPLHKPIEIGVLHQKKRNKRV